MGLLTCANCQALAAKLLLLNYELSSANEELNAFRNPHPGHRHFAGKTYEMTQANWNKLLRELELAQSEIAALESQIERGNP